MVYVYALDLEKLKEPKDYPQIFEGLPEYRKKKIESFRNPNGRRESFGAGILLQMVCRRHGRSDQEILEGEHGKPEIEGFYFNLSHSGNMVLCVVSESPVGCDIEKIETPTLKIAKRFFTENENIYLDHFEENEKAEEFFRLWTMKEAYVKMTGEGLTCSLKDFEIQIDDEIQIYRDQILQSCCVKEYSVSGYKVSVCATEHNFADDIVYLELENESCI